MTSIQLYAKLQKDIPSASPWADYTLLDLSEAEPIRITKSVIDLSDPTVVPSAFSQTFILPGTARNGFFFKGIFNVNSQDYNPSLKIDSYINIEGEFYMSGSLRFLKVITNDRDNTNEYEVQFIGETRTFGGQIESKYLAELNLDNWVHELTYDNILLSWNANLPQASKLLDGDVLYPLVEYGYLYSEIEQPINTTLAIYSGTTGGSIKGFTDSINPLLIQQFKPFLRAKIIWDQIFAEAGFTYTSNFLSGGTGSFFSSLYYTSTTDSNVLAFPIAPFTNSFGVPQQMPLFASTWVPLIFKTNPVEQDFYNAYNPVIGRFAVPGALSYLNFSMRLDISYRTKAGSGSPGFAVRVWRIRNGINTLLVLNSFSVPSSNTFPATYTATAFQSCGATLPGDEFYWEIWCPVAYFNFLRINDGRLTGIFPNLVNPSMMFPSDQYTQADFIKGITNKFNLIWQPDPNNPNNFLIEPWNDWVAQGNQYDWTEKLDEAVDIDVEPLFYRQERTMTFKDAEEGDYLNFNFEQKYKRTFGTLEKQSPIQIIADEREVSTFFAQVPLAPIGNSATFLIPHFAQDSQTRREPIQVKPRLCFYNGLVNNPAGITWYMGDNTAQPQAQSQYPLVSSFYGSYPFSTNSFDLCFNNAPQFWDPAENGGVDGQTGITAFVSFWENWYNATYSPYSKVMTANFVLNTKDIKNLQFNDLVFIKNAWWMPTKFTDFALGSEQSVEVELVKYGDLTLNIGATGTSPLELNLQSGLCYGLSACQACCCDGNLVTNLYTDGKSMSDSLFAYATLNGVPAQAGFYKQGSFAYQVNSVGTIVGVYLCSVCSCATVVPEFLIEEEACEGSSFCEAYCCQGGTAMIWTDGGFTGATEIFSSASGDPVTPFNWYHVSGTEMVYQVGSDGFTVVQGVTGGGCACNALDYSAILSYGVGASGQFAACCISGTTGASGPQTVWMDAPYFLDASDFYEDSTGEIPYGDGVEIWFSDGENWVGVSGGTDTTGGSCGDPDLCPGRTNQVDTRLRKLVGASSATLTSQNYISFDNSSYYWANQDVGIGVTFDYTYGTMYAPDSWFQNRITTGPGLTGTISYSVYENSIQVLNDTFPVVGSTSYNLQEFQTGTGAWLVEIEIIPT